MLLIDNVAELNFRRFTQVAHQRFESDLGVILGDPLNHRFFLLFRHRTRFHFVQRQQHHVALQIGAHAVAWLTRLRQRKCKDGLAQRFLTGA